MKRTMHHIIASCLICSPLITACVSSNNINSGTPQTSGSATTSQEPAKKLSSMTWKLSSIQDSRGVSSTLLRSGDATSRYQVTIQDGQFSVSGGCNVLSGGFTLGANNAFSVSRMLQTKRACMGTLMTSDSEITTYFRQLNRYTLTDQTLSLITNNGEKLNFNGTATDATKYGSEGIRSYPLRNQPLS